MSVFYPNVRVGVQSDQAPIINAAFNDIAIDVVSLPQGIVWIGQSIVVPPNKSLLLRPQTVVRALAEFEDVGDVNAGVVLAGSRASVSGGTIDMNKVGTLAGQGRKNGVMTINGARDTVKRDLIVMNCTGYGNYTAGVEQSVTPPSSLSVNVTTYNCQVHHESQASDGDIYLACHAWDGDGDIPTGSFFHPLAGARNCHFVSCTAKGSAGSGAEITTNVSQLQNITFTDCDIEIAGSGAAISIPAEFNAGIDGLRVIGGTYRTTGIAAAIRYATGCIFSGVTLIGRNAMESTNSEVECVGCRAIAGSDPGGTGTGRGVIGYGTGRVRWNAGSISVTGPEGLNNSTTLGNVRVSSDTLQIPAEKGSNVELRQEVYQQISPVIDGQNSYANFFSERTPLDLEKVHFSVNIRSLNDGYQPNVSTTWSRIENNFFRIRVTGASLSPDQFRVDVHFIEYE